MKKFILTFSLLICVVSLTFAQTYVTPNTGVTLTLDDIATNSPSTITVSGNQYTMLENIEVSESDTVIIDSDLTLLVDQNLLLTVFGSFTVTADAVTITSLDTANPFEGFRFEEFSQIDIQNTTITFSGGLKVLTEDFTINNCVLDNNVSGASTGSVISLSRGEAQITNNSFSNNELPAVSSAANSSVSANIFNNYMEANNQSNSNRPQINMGPTMDTATLKIVQNTIIGDPSLDQVGGIAVANFVGGTILAVIEDNIIRDNRYGMTVVGSNAFVSIINNIIEDNNTQNIPNLGGSGISLNTSSGTQEIIATGNEIRRNLWGITVIGTASINLGDDVDNPGENVFSENGNSGEVYALYNNTANTLLAKHNCWIEGQDNTSADAEAVIFHQADDNSLGEVIYDPVGCQALSTTDFSVNDFSFYPNPVTTEINFNNTASFTTLKIFGLQGNLIETKIISEGENTIQINVASGMYFANFSNNKTILVRKMVVQ